MTKRKKLTMKEVEERLNILAYNINVSKAGTDNVGLAFAEYLKFRNTEKDFKKYLENKANINKLKESVKKDAK